MLSLSNSFSETDLIKFDKRVKEMLDISEDIKYSIEPKIDGISISLHYDKGVLVEALTRGDGEVGEVVTANVKQIKNLPHQIDFKEPINFRGEIYLSNLEFERINNDRMLKGEQVFSNPRNAAAGTMRQKNPMIVSERTLSIFVYSAHTSNGEAWGHQTETISKIKGLGFPVSSESTWSTGIKKTINEIKKIEKKRTSIEYEIDGVVIKIDDMQLHEQIGSTAKFPRWATAYKFPAEVKETKLLKIWSTIGRTGRVTYNAKLEPVKLMGTTVQAATLHNAEYVEALDLREGDTVFVKKAGDIIPKVIGTKRDTDSKKWNREKICTSCKKILIQNKGEVDQYCVNEFCPAKIKESLIHFVSRDGMNIEGLAVKQIELFIKQGWLRRFEDIFNLFKKRNEIISLNGYKEKSVDKLLDSIEKAKNNSIEKLLFAFGIRNIGKKTALEIAMNFNSLSKIEKSSIEDFNDKSDFGDVKSQSIVQWFSSTENKKTLNEIIKMGVNDKYLGERVIETILTGKTVVVTGSISGGTREDIKKTLTSFGANVSTSPSPKTEYIFVGAKASQVKVQKAPNAIIINVETIREIKDYVRN